jgi:hypothetical protein
MKTSCASTAVPLASSLATTQRFGGAGKFPVGQVDAGASGYGRLGPPRNDGYGSTGKDYKDYAAGEPDLQQWRHKTLFEGNSSQDMHIPLLLLLLLQLQQTYCLVLLLVAQGITPHCCCYGVFLQNQAST